MATCLPDISNVPVAEVKSLNPITHIDSINHDPHVGVVDKTHAVKQRMECLNVEEL